MCGVLLCLYTDFWNGGEANCTYVENRHFKSSDILGKANYSIGRTYLTKKYVYVENYV